MTLIDKLDFALQENVINSSFNDEPGQNVLIIGPTGTGKTAQVKQWCKEHSDDVDYYKILANTHPHMSELEVDGGKIRCLFGKNEIDNFNKENKILIIDHFDLTDNEVRKELMSLVKNREITSPYLGGKKIKLDKFWYIIAIAYPEGHFGYDALSKEDIGAFDFVFESVEFSSNAQTEDEYIEDVVKDIISKLDEEDKKYYIDNPEYDHMFIGTWIRNEYIWNKDVPSEKHPDDLSAIIFDKFINKLKANNK